MSYEKTWLFNGIKYTRNQFPNDIKTDGYETDEEYLDDLLTIKREGEEEDDIKQKEEYISDLIKKKATEDKMESYKRSRVSYTEDADFRDFVSYVSIGDTKMKEDYMNIRKMDEILRKHPDYINKQTAMTGITPLMYYVEQDCESCIAYLLTAIPKADPNITDSWRFTALHRAIYKKNKNIIKLLIDFGTNMSYVIDDHPSNPVYNKNYLDYAIMINSPQDIIDMLKPYYQKKGGRKSNMKSNRKSNRKSRRTKK